MQGFFSCTVQIFSTVDYTCRLNWHIYNKNVFAMRKNYFINFKDMYFNTYEIGILLTINNYS